MVRFRVLMRARNAQDYIGKAIGSIVSQGYPGWLCTVALDAPTDRTYFKAMNCAIPRSRFTMKLQKEHLGLVGNLVSALDWMELDPEAVVAMVDGDDYVSPDALRVVAKVYEKYPDTLLTYGSYVKVSKGCKTKTSKAYPGDADVRTYRWHGSHLKTFKAKLWNALPKEHLMHDGIWLPAASDLAIMIPMMEIAGLDRCRHVKQAIYYYRDKTPQKTNVNLQKKCERIIRLKPRLQRIESI
jgi:glycosyltransferase involved in cell wall biosynthesis